MTGYEIFVGIVTCVTPLIVGFLGYKSSVSEKRTKEYMEAQKELSELNLKIKETEQKELLSHLTDIDNSIIDVQSKIGKMERQINEIATIKKSVEKVLVMSKENSEFCISLSNIISSIGTSLDLSSSIETDELHEEIRKHKEERLKYIKSIMDNNIG